MKYTVVWTKSAENALASLWIAHASPQKVADAADAIDRDLAFNPSRFGDESSAGFRQMVVGPIGIDFRISERDRTVTILTVWLVPEVLLLVPLLVLSVGAWQVQHRELAAGAVVDTSSVVEETSAPDPAKRPWPFIEPDTFRPDFEFFAPADDDHYEPYKPGLSDLPGDHPRIRASNFIEPDHFKPDFDIDLSNAQDCGTPLVGRKVSSELPDDGGRSSNSPNGDFEFAKEFFESSEPQE